MQPDIDFGNAIRGKPGVKATGEDPRLLLLIPVADVLGSPDFYSALQGGAIVA